MFQSDFNRLKLRTKRKKGPDLFLSDIEKTFHHCSIGVYVCNFVFHKKIILLLKSVFKFYLSILTFFLFHKLLINRLRNNKKNTPRNILFPTNPIRK